MTPRHSGRAAWIADLDRLDPHLVVVTGDFLAHVKAVPFVLDALAPLLLRPGLFTLGSNDYWAPRFKDPTRYLRADDGRRSVGTPLPWNDLVDGLVGAGWHDLDNRRSTITVDGRTLDTRGTDDPHIRRDRYDEVAGPFSPEADLRLGVRRQSIDPAVANAIAELLLLAPQDAVRQIAIERFTQHRLLDTATAEAAADHLVRGVDAHRHIEEVAVQERHARLHAPGHH